MLQRLHVRRTFNLGVCALAALLLSAGAAQAAAKKSKAKAKAKPKPSSTSCGESWKNADTLAKEGQLRKAREWMHKCAALSCPKNIARECAARSTQLGIDIPTIVPSVTDKQDRLNDVEVSMDGEVLAAKIDGRALQVDPGLHEFVFKSGSGEVARQTLVIQQGQRNRSVAVSFSAAESQPLAKAPVTAFAVAPPPASPAAAVASRTSRAELPAQGGGGFRNPPPTPLVLGAVGKREFRNPSLTTYLLGGVGALGVTGFFLTSNWARKDDQILLRNCSPECKPAAIDHVRKLFLASKISLGVGAAALVGGAVLFVKDGWFSSGETASLTPPRYALEVVPTASGGWAAFSGAF